MNWLSAAVAALVVPLVFQFFRRSQRRCVASLRERYDLANLEAKYGHYRKWDVATALLLGLPLTGLAVFGSYKFLTWLARVGIPDVSDTLRVVPADRIVFMLPAAVSGLLLSFGLAWCAWRLVLRQNYEEWMIYGILKQGIDHRRVVRWLLPAVALPAIVLLSFGFDFYSIATERQVIVNRMWSLGETAYDYDQIETIEVEHRARRGNGAVGSVPIWSIRFRDGTSWVSQRGFLEVDPEVLDVHRAFVETIAEQARQPVQVKFVRARQEEAPGTSQ
ncbi:MAG: hypothetical protein DWQ31_00735 [Planctomycetota bacterium]|nr:MAG: hypothetical protein DWQ31_00735 [Planctomycetota bacterium]REJ86713.1 MAG: hypothetical protein DWQ35_23075 [Planctomycetota bacterium]REK27114.1 MAG: hypothetical protein DWQ42_07345 [Planctomycetota bacterium]REK37888.1 MAG: hypothetical protein DWQ46_21765 [Planctomycetota bacterium]